MDHNLITALLTSNSSYLSNSSANAFISSAQRIAAHSLATAFQSVKIDKLLNGAKVDPKDRKRVDAATMKSLAECDRYGGDFIIDTVQIYARPIQRIGEHNTDDTPDSEVDHKENAEMAANGYHHSLIILSGGKPQPIQYLLDRVEGVRFVKKEIVYDELVDGHLILIKEFTNLTINYQNIKPFILRESAVIYNLVNNNCLTFVYQFIDQILQKNEWGTFNKFWQFIRSNFDKTDIKNGKYNKAQNYMLKHDKFQYLQYQQNIRYLDEKQRRLSWNSGDKILIKSTDFKGQMSWHRGKIIHIQNEMINIEYVKMGNIFFQKYPRDSSNLKPFIQIPSQFLDPISKKIMTKPVQILQSGMVYDEITVQCFQQFFSGDPVTGVPFESGPVIVELDVLRDKIRQFRATHDIGPELINDIESLRDKELWETVHQKLIQKCDIKQHQKLIYGKSVTLFYPEGESKVSHSEDETKDFSENEHTNQWKCNMCTFLNASCMKQCEICGEQRQTPLQNNVNCDSDAKYNEDLDILKWNTDTLFINHTSIPMITCMGPSRLGKSFLLNEMLRNQQTWKRHLELKSKVVFATSDSANIPQTKGAWITLYGDIDQETKASDNDIYVLNDVWPEDDILMWTNDDLFTWLSHLNPHFGEIYAEMITLVQENKFINGKTFNLLNDMGFLSNIGIKGDRAKLLKDILEKRFNKKMDAIEKNCVDQMYLVDMEGLTHGVTDFTKKLFQGCYAISNVVLWFDDRVMSDKFVKLMKKLKENMKIIATSDRKPAFIYILRNGDQTQFDFENTDDKDEFDHFLKNHHSCQWFRDMKMFSSVHGYLLDSPENLRRKKGKKKKPIYYERDALNHLIHEIKLISKGTCRFANNTMILNQQVDNINENNQLSMEKRISLCNSRLKWFVFVKDSEKKKLQLKNAVVVFEYDINTLDKQFSLGYESLIQQLKVRQLLISSNFDEELKQNKDEIKCEIQRINKKRQNEKNSVGTTTKFCGSVALGSLAVAVAGASLLTPAGWIGLGVVGGMSTVATIGGLIWKPKKLDQFINRNVKLVLSELKHYDG